MPALDAELSGAVDLDPRDAGLATELVYGVLRTAAFLERRIARHAKSERYKAKPATRAHMLIAAYSLAFLDRVPAHAAVDEAVGAIKASADRKVAGFANAVLRKIAREDRTSDVTDAMRASFPRWLVAALDQAVGPAGVDTIVQSGRAGPHVDLCLRAGESRDAWLEQLRAATSDTGVAPGRVSPRAISLSGVGSPRRLPGAGTSWTVQEEGAQVVALAAGARPTEQVLDACAGRGGKAMLLAEALAGEGSVDAADLHEGKLAGLAAWRHGTARIRHLYGVDWTRGSGDITRQYDRVLVDAPCTGVGTLRRRPEIALRLKAHDPMRMAALQLEIMRGAARRVRPGGRLIYAVCSVLAEECERVVEALTQDRAPGLRIEQAGFDSDLGRSIAGEAATFRLLPSVHGTDGYFVASFVVG